MNKFSLIDNISDKTNVPKTVVESVIDTLTEVVSDTIIKGEEVSIVGFGKWIPFTRAPRRGVDPRNPKKMIDMPEVKMVKFRTGYRLREDIKKG